MIKLKISNNKLKYLTKIRFWYPYFRKKNRKEDGKVRDRKETKEHKEDNETRSSRISAQQSSLGTTTHEGKTLLK